MLPPMTLGIIIAQIVVISLLVLLLGAIGYADWRNVKRREAEEAEARTRREAALEADSD